MQNHVESWELPVRDEADDAARKEAPSEPERWQFSMKRLLAATFVLATLLAAGIPLANWFQIASTKLQWKQLTIREATRLSTQKQYAILLRGTDYDPRCGSISDCINNYALKAKVRELRCDIRSLHMPNDLPVLLEIVKQFPEVQPAPGMLLLIDRGKGISAAKALSFEYAEQLEAFRTR
jgi:hypothetical protein